MRRHRLISRFIDEEIYNIVLCYYKYWYRIKNLGLSKYFRTNLSLKFHFMLFNVSHVLFSEQQKTHSYQI